MIEFKPATREDIKPLIGFFAESGGGKTFSALLLGRGIVGPKGKLGIADTEDGRGAMFCDMIPGGYFHFKLNPPFSPERYIEVIDGAEAAGIECLVIDSTSHEWVGIGGYLDMKEAALDRMAGSDWKKRDACKFAASAQCKPEHMRFVDRLCRAKPAIILCFRAKEKVRMEKDSNGKNVIHADENVSPIQDSGLIFEMLVAGEIYAKEGKDGMDGGYFRRTKHTHPELKKCLPSDGERIGIEHGEAVARWCKGMNEPEAPVPKPGLAYWKKRIWDTAKPKFSDIKAFQKWLHDEALMDPSESLGQLNEDQLESLTAKVQTKLDNE